MPRRAGRAGGCCERETEELGSVWADAGRAGSGRRTMAVAEVENSPSPALWRQGKPRGSRHRRRCRRLRHESGAGTAPRHGGRVLPAGVAPRRSRAASVTGGREASGRIPPSSASGDWAPERRRTGHKRSPSPEPQTRPGTRGRGGLHMTCIFGVSQRNPSTLMRSLVGFANAPPEHQPPPPPPAKESAPSGMPGPFSARHRWGN